VRLLWVVPRFGPGVVGGAETLVRSLARDATPSGWTSEIATTCALDHATWRNELPAGRSTEDGLDVHRFEVDPRDVARFDLLHRRLLSGGLGYAAELSWLSNGVCSRSLEEFLDETRDKYDLRIFAPYLFGTTLWGALVAPSRSVLLPCLHDEPYARLGTVGRVLRAVRGCIFNSEAERRLVERLAGPTRGGVVGVGFDPPAPAEPDAPPHDELGDYVIYAGRLEEGKGVHEAVAHAVRHRRLRPDSPTLVLIGRGDFHPPKEARGVVKLVGYVDEQRKRELLRGALALVQPSAMESFSIVLMESWREGTPALVNRRSEVMSDHCAASQGGHAFGSFEEYRAHLDRWLDDESERRARGAAGQRYVAESYSKEAVARRLQTVLEELAS
jgi:glycosyltransferase involved in cell wall biosynthesis